MRRFVLVMTGAALLGGPALAQHASGSVPAPAARPAPATATAATAHVPYTLETPILTLMEDPRTLAFLDKHLPGLSARMRDEEVATIFGSTSLDDMSKDPDHGRALTPDVMVRLAKLLADAQADTQPAT